MIKPDKYIEIDVSQLQVGVYVVLNTNWVEHPFFTNSFQIKNNAQIETIKRLGLKKINYSPGKSKRRPLEQVNTQLEIVEKELSVIDKAAISSKKARVKRLHYHNQLVTKCGKQMLEATRLFNTINKNLFPCPKESVAAAQELIDQMVSSLITDKDIAIHAMNDKVAGEDIYHHSLNVAVLAMILAKELGLSKEIIGLVGMGAIFHDVGKTEIPRKILYSKETLSKQEQKVLELHTTYGERIGNNLKLPKLVVDIIRHHHERLDGSGYPDALRGKSFKPLSQIVAIANTFDGLCNNIELSKSLTPYEAISTVFVRHREHFNSNALGVFIQRMGVYPPGTIVGLSDDNLGIVVSLNIKNPVNPSVLIYSSEIPKQEAMIIDLIEEPDINIVKTYHPSQLPNKVFNYLSPRPRTVFYFSEDPGVAGQHHDF